VLEKGAEVGAHILSGAVVDPDRHRPLLPDWREDADHPFKTAGDGRPFPASARPARCACPIS
jgi:flavin-dependent dehydrogenase